LDQVPAIQCELLSDWVESQGGLWQVLDKMTLAGMGDGQADSATFIVKEGLICCLHAISRVWTPRPQLTEQGLQSVIDHL
jgi:hypothetical protein